jgi:hypothetical protein
MKSTTAASCCRSTFRQISPSLLALSCVVFLNVSSSRAQTVTVVKNHSTAISKQAQNLALIPVKHQKLLSSAQQRILYLNTVLQGPGATGQTDSTTARFAAAPAAASSPIPGPYLRVSDPRLDYGNSVMTSFTQSETSSAWCGNTIVVGYNDSGAFARTAGINGYYSPWSFSSVSYSHDRGETFTEAGYMNPGVNPINFIAGDPVVACSSPTQFYYSSIFAAGQDSFGNYFNGVAVNVSSDGGMTWGSPVAAVAKDFSHTIDKPWIAADPSNANRLYVTYTDFDFSGYYGNPAAACPYDIRYAIELVVSGDGGNTWSAPVTVHQECYYSSGGNAVQGSNPAVAADGTLYVGYEFYPGSSPNDEIHLATSQDNGQSIFSDLKVSNVWPNGNFGLLQGGFRNNEFPQVAVDRSSSPTHGTVYIAWSDGAANIVPDLPSFFGSYSYPDVRVASSTDRGTTFSAPVTVSPVPADFTGRGRDQFFPGIAVDGKGHVGVCYYDRRQSPDNSRIDRYCSMSRDAGASWDEERVSKFGWTPAHASDGVINLSYIGDYDAVSSDFLLRHKGFFSTFEVQFNGNPDVLGSRLERDE